MTNPYLEPLREAVHTYFSGLAAEAGCSRRLFHGRGQCFPGLEQVTLDWFDPVLVFTVFSEHLAVPEQVCLDVIQEALAGRGERVQALVIQRRYLPGSPMAIVAGQLPENIYARRGSNRFHLHLGQQQNSGFFLDIEPGRQWLAERAEGRRVLNLFAYTCAFSVVAQAAGAASVVNVDMSRAALSQGRDNHRLNQQPLDNVRFLGENILKSWGRIKRAGPFDIAIVDPPSYQPGSFVASRDYPKVIRRIPEMMAAGGEVLLCLNAPELGVEFVQNAVAEQGVGMTFVARLAAHPDFPDHNPEQQLKLLHYRVNPPA